ncbi:MAG TPA: rhamnan synthesis F family protein [Sphingobium sp.]|uniref:rhamnan synthesis F family protein n=1 Tax=Sphingobium sp. TaxID=1912891 RepID=UPI002ED2742D
MTHDVDDAFDAEWYVNEYPDVGWSGLSPAEHYRTIGKLLGRVPTSSHAAISVRHAIVRKTRFTANDEVAVLVTHASGGRLRPHVLPYMRHFRRNGLSVLLVVVVDRPLELLDEEIAATSMIIVRDNAGYDFGAWAHAFQICPSLFGTRLLIMTNDSIIPTGDSAAFQAMMDRVRASQSDICGLTANHEYGWHIQSYFLALKGKALRSDAFKNFIGSVRRIDDKDKVVQEYEITFASRMRDADLKVEALYHGPYPNNPVIWSWRELIEAGFPFIKLLLLRKVMATYTDDKEMLEELHETWPSVLKKAGFDVNLVHNAIRAANMSWLPEGPNKDLLLHPEKYHKAALMAQDAE